MFYCSVLTTLKSNETDCCQTLFIHDLHLTLRPGIFQINDKKIINYLGFPHWKTPGFPFIDEAITRSSSMQSYY